MFEAEPQSYDRVLSSMCTEPHPVAVEAAHRFLGSNPGDPASFPNIAAIEAEVVERLGVIAGHPDAAGYVASGGTEANIQALHVARNRADVKRPNVVVPSSAHVSFQKAAALLGVEYRRCALDAEGRADLAAMEARIDDQTVMVVGVAGTTEYGRVDPIPAIARIGQRDSIHVHVDAAWGGFLLPFTEHAWDFADAPIDTLTIDPHKCGRAAIPAGGFLARSASLLDLICFEAPYLEDGRQVTLTGTRSGAGVASTAAVLRTLWPGGYQRAYEDAMENARWLASAFADRGYDVVPVELPLVAVDVPEETFSRLRSAGWRISRTATGELRIVCMPHVTRPRLERFIEALDRVRTKSPRSPG